MKFRTWESDAMLKSPEKSPVDERLEETGLLGERLRQSEDRVGELRCYSARLEREIEDLLAVGEVAHSIAATASIEGSLTEILGRIQRLLDAERIILGLVNDAGGFEEVKVALGIPAADLRGSRWPIDESDPSWATLLAAPHSLLGLRGDEPHLPDYVRTVFPLGFLKSPMVAKGRLIGTIMVSLEEAEPSRRDVRLLRILVGHAALAIENGRLNYDVIKSEEHLNRIHEQLAEARSMAAVGQLAVSINHEINNPLCTINMSAQLLRIDLEDRAPELIGRLDSIEEAVQRILAVTRKVSAMSRLRSTEYLPNQMMIDLK
jgi:GAF domain-containing protein